MKQMDQQRWEQIKDLLEAATAMAPQQRCAFLDGASSVTAASSFFNRTSSLQSD